MEQNEQNKKKDFWSIVIKVAIAVLSALAGALGTDAMNLNILPM